MKKEEAINLILMELAKAEKKHPAWPRDKVHQAAILAEECGEVVQATLDCHYHGGDIEKLRTELAHTGAMAIRCLMHIDDKPQDKVIYPGSCAETISEGPGDKNELSKYFFRRRNRKINKPILSQVLQTRQD